MLCVNGISVHTSPQSTGAAGSATQPHVSESLVRTCFHYHHAGSLRLDIIFFIAIARSTSYNCGEQPPKKTQIVDEKKCDEKASEQCTMLVIMVVTRARARTRTHIANTLLFMSAACSCSYDTHNTNHFFRRLLCSHHPFVFLPLARWILWGLFCSSNELAEFGCSISLCGVRLLRQISAFPLHRGVGVFAHVSAPWNYHDCIIASLVPI